ncbi:MAG: methylated-DNA--[protein]-cysteine S-methyltransferase [Bacteroidales bacterium]
MLFYSSFDSPLGKLTAASVDDKICMLEFSDSNRVAGTLEELSALTGYTPSESTGGILTDLSFQLDEYFSGKRKVFDLPVKFFGSDFRIRVWNELLRIPYGETRTYLQQTLLLGDSKAIRAVASANGANRIAILVPCHRVMGANGKLTGYAGGIWRKRWLLELERSNYTDKSYLYLF